MTDEFEKLRELTEMYRAGELTDAEFSAMKQHLIGGANQVNNDSAASASTSTHSVVPTPAPAPTPQTSAVSTLTSTNKTPLFFILIVAILFGVIAATAGYITGSLLFAPNAQDASKERRTAYKAAYKEAYDRSYKDAKESAYDDAYRSAKTASAKVGRIKGMKAGAKKGRVRGTAKGKASV